jgi:trans-aconitate methyltransferase
MASTWKEVWEARRLDPAYGSLLAQLLAADGFDESFARFSDEAWRRHVLRTAATIGIGAGDSVFDVGCGAGAYLYELDRQGCTVAGLDGSSALIRCAAGAMPRGTWIHADAAALDVDAPYDFVIASASFHYFASLEYAGGVLQRMVRKARRGIMVLDVPDLAKRDEAIELRRRLAGSEAYKRKYDGLDHLYFSRGWFEAALARLGIARVEIADQQIEGYANAAHRYNVFAWLAPTGRAAQPQNQAPESADV